MKIKKTVLFISVVPLQIGQIFDEMLLKSHKDDRQVKVIIVLELRF